MVSKASDDFPDPDSPVITTRLSRGRSTSIFLRLCSRAPRTRISCMRLNMGRGIGSHYSALTREDAMAHLIFACKTALRSAPAASPPLDPPRNRQHQNHLRHPARGEAQRAQHRDAERVDDVVREPRPEIEGAGED